SGREERDRNGIGSGIGGPPARLKPDGPFGYLGGGVNHPVRSERQMAVGVDPEAEEDDTLLERVANGDRIALRILYERHAPGLFLRLARRAADPALVEDAVQDTFVVVWRRASTYQGSGAVA